MKNNKLLGRRIRHYRTKKGYTLAQLGARIDKSAAILSMIESGRREPSLSTLDAIAEELEVPTADLFSEEAPNKRAQLEMEFERFADSDIGHRLGWQTKRAARGLPDPLLEDISNLFHEASRLREVRSRDEVEAMDRAIDEVREEWQTAKNHSEEIEKTAAEALKKAGYDGSGNITKPIFHALARQIGYRLVRVEAMPLLMHTAIDLKHKRIYVRKADFLRTTESRSVLAHNLGHLYLSHAQPKTFADKIRARLSAGYFAGAALIPEENMQRKMIAGAKAGDLSLDDLRQSFYVSYEMAAHRFTNLAYKHLGVETHFLRSDVFGRITKSFAVDGLKLPRQSLDPQRATSVCRNWASARIFRQPDRFAPVYQVSQNIGEGYFCIARIPDEQKRTDQAITIGCRRRDGHIFRGFKSAEKIDVGQTPPDCPLPNCCKLIGKAGAARWDQQYRYTAHRMGDVIDYVTGRNILPEEIQELYEFLDKSKEIEAE